MKFKTVLIVVTASFIGGFVSFFLTQNFSSSNTNNLSSENQEHITRAVSYNGMNVSDVNFNYAAEKSLDAVVHITTQYTQKYRSNSLYDFFYGNSNQTYSKEVPLASGSGVIISNDGYIVTNNHVIDNSDKIKVVLNDKRSYDAKLVGTDKSTDLALLKIEANNLPFLPYGNSDELSIGDWVLAVGNPFNLNSTVTAGIVSAKARNINIMNQQYAIESFIQTDAAVNPGNSGGALVNRKGQLVGVNTAIASKTGSYVGYSFAIPVSIVQKIVTDLIQFGSVQRAYLDVNIADINAEIKEQFNLDKIEGVFVSNATKGGAADNAGIKNEDVIVKINDISVNTVSELQEQISKYRPADKLKVTINRKGDNKTFTVVLNNKFGNTEVVTNSDITFLGASLKEIPTDTKRYLGLKYGVQIKDVGSKQLYKKGIKNSFIITSINKIPIYEPSDVVNILKKIKHRIIISGIYPNGLSSYYIVDL